MTLDHLQSMVCVGMTLTCTACVYTCQHICKRKSQLETSRNTFRTVELHLSPTHSAPPTKSHPLSPSLSPTYCTSLHYVRIRLHIEMECILDGWWHAYLMHEMATLKFTLHVLVAGALLSCYRSEAQGNFLCWESVGYSQPQRVSVINLVYTVN